MTTEVAIGLPDISYADHLPWAEIYTALGDGDPDISKRVIVLYNEPNANGTVQATARYF